MADKFDKAKRSEIMSKVHGANTKPEMIVRHILFSLGYRYRLHKKDMPGTPDIVLPKYRIVINVHGCFWHGCPYCKRAKVRPIANAGYWERKLNRNLERDKVNIAELENKGWKVIIVWECETKKKNLGALTEKLRTLPEME
jgi:DNA mismatch endonuclease (patch repair protein)